ncbi:MAG: 3-dehydroquinate synthase [Candidatus Brocadiia bacterium]
MRSVRIPLGERSYDILMGFDCLHRLGAAMRERRIARDNVAIVTSPRIGGLYYDTAADGLGEADFAHIGRWDLPDGEENKNLDNFASAVRWLAQFAPDPSIRPVVVALGGGVVGDLGGFAAACFRRGVPYVQAPTTLLAAVDSSVGGKTAVNLPEGKNLVGAFYQPRLVFMDLGTLDTLDARQVRSGASEVIKYGAILDAELFEFLEKNIQALTGLDRGALMRVVPTCVELKADLVQRDERDEAHVRVCLNFGHTLGHAMERAAGGRLTHGEAVAVGMVAAADISVELGLCGSEVAERLRDVLRRAGLPLSVKGLELDEVLRLMQHDKKFIKGTNRFVLLEGIGRWTEREGVPEDVIRPAARNVLS